MTELILNQGRIKLWEWVRIRHRPLQIQKWDFILSLRFQSKLKIKVIKCLRFMRLITLTQSSSISAICSNMITRIFFRIWCKKSRPTSRKVLWRRKSCLRQWEDSISMLLQSKTALENKDRIILTSIYNLRASNHQLISWLLLTRRPTMGQLELWISHHSLVLRLYLTLRRYILRLTLTMFR